MLWLGKRASTAEVAQVVALQAFPGQEPAVLVAVRRELWVNPPTETTISAGDWAVADIGGPAIRADDAQNRESWQHGYVPGT